MNLTSEDRISIEGLASTLGVRVMQKQEVMQVARESGSWSLSWHIAQGASFSALLEPSMEKVTYLSECNRFASTHERVYFMALHELGHHACGHTVMDKTALTDLDVLAKEQEAWQWAKDHANRAPSKDALAYMQLCLDTYRQAAGVLA